MTSVCPNCGESAVGVCRECVTQLIEQHVADLAVRHDFAIQQLYHLIGRIMQRVADLEQEHLKRPAR